MMITIHGFPAKTKFQDVKMLIKQECNINDFILDNLLSDTDGTKKVRIGLADNTEGFKVMKCLDGYRMPGNFILKAVPIGKAAGRSDSLEQITQPTDSAARNLASQPPQASSFDSRPSYQNQPRNDYPNAPRNDYMGPGPNDYNNGSHGPGAPHSHGVMHGSVGPHGPGAPLSHGGIHGSHAPVGPHGPRTSQGGPHSHGGGPPGPIDNRPSPWVSGGGNNGNQWNKPMATQVPQNTFGFTPPQANVNPSYGQQPHQSQSQSQPRPPFNQARSGDQGYGYTPKNVPEVVPANSRYRWVRKAEPEPKDPKSPHPDEDSSSPSSVDDLDESSQDVLDDVDKQGLDETSQDVLDDVDKQGLDETSQDVLDDVDKQGSGETSNTLDPSEARKSKKARKREQARLRNINNLKGSKRRRLFFWLKQGKTFMEARELCETRLNRIAEYPAAKAEKKRKAREVALRRMSPERQARAIKVDRLKGRGLPGAPAPVRPPCQPIRVRILDELELMSQEKIEMLEDKILELVDAETDGNEPSFVGYSGRPGGLMLSCANSQTLEWLENHLPDLHIWEGANIKIVNLSELPRPVIGVAYVADPDLGEEDILSMLKFQNKGMNFSDWWITSKKPDYPAGQTVTFSMDKFSADKLAEKNNFLILGSRTIKIRLRLKKAQAPPGQGKMPPRKQMVKGKGNMGMPPNPPMGQKSKGPKGKMGMPPRVQTGVAPMYQMGMGQKGKGPQGKMGMPPKVQSGVAPMYQMGMGPMGMGHMGPMGMGPMGPMGMGPMGPMGMGPMGMGPMGFYPSASNSAEMYGPPQGSSYDSDFSQQKHFKGGYQPNRIGGGNGRGNFSGGNQPKYFGGGGKHSKKKPSGPVNNNSGPNPQQGNAPKKLSPSKARRNKERMMEYIIENPNKVIKSWKKRKGGAPS